MKEVSKVSYFSTELEYRSSNVEVSNENIALNLQVPDFNSSLIIDVTRIGDEIECRSPNFSKSS